MEYYDPHSAPPPIRRRASTRQSKLSLAFEALGGGAVIAIIVAIALHALGWR